MVSLRRYVTRRLFLAAVTLFGVIVAVFILTRILPGNPAAVRLGPYAKPELLAALEHEMGLDQPLPVQFYNYVAKLARGEMGKSWRTGQPVRKDLTQRLPATLELALAATLMAVVVGHILGVLGAIKQNSLLDQIIRGIAILGASTALFWLALVFIYFFYFRLGWAAAPLDRLDVGIQPPTRITGIYVVDSLLTGNLASLRSSLGHLLLPAVTLAFVVSAPITKIVRAAMLDVLNSDFIRTAHTIGVPYREILFRDALRNALIPILTTIGIVFGYLMAGSVLVEQIFAWPGLGSYAWMALVNKDFEAIQGFVLLIAALYVMLNLAIDLLYSLIDPRIRLG
ncbi:MAG TPA: peptide ABC transporter permease [Chloroflexi bacterium]|nr:peptide ABC transporter permease [Chloroflexota bacterium]